MDPGTGAGAPTATAADLVAALIQARQTILPKRLAAPGPDAVQLEMILGAAAAAPDHGGRVPWRFVIVPDQARAKLAGVFAGALRERDASATAQQLEAAREKAFRAPLLMLAIVRLGPPGDEVPDLERLISAGCAIQNMLLMATALGYGSALTSGKALGSAGLRELFGLEADEQALCFVNAGTVAARKSQLARPTVAQYVTTLAVQP